MSDTRHRAQVAPSSKLTSQSLPPAREGRNETAENTSALVAAAPLDLPPFTIDRNEVGLYDLREQTAKVSAPMLSLLAFLDGGPLVLESNEPELVARRVEEGGLQYAICKEFQERAARRQLCAGLRRFITEVEQDEARRDANEPSPVLLPSREVDIEDDSNHAPKTPEEVERNKSIAEDLIADMGKLLDRLRGLNGWILEHITGAYTECPNTRLFYEDDGRVAAAFGRVLFADVDVHAGRNHKGFGDHCGNALEFASFYMTLDPGREENLLHLAAAALHRAKVAEQEGGAA